MAPIEAVLLGAGQRGRWTVGGFAERQPAELKFIAVAEPDAERRHAFAEIHGIPAERQFASWQELLARPRLAPLCFNMTMDRAHLPSALAALEAGYELFLEKPMADSPGACLRIAEEAKKRGRMVQICHPLRYSPFYNKLKSLLDEGAIGRVTSLTMHENVGYWHYAHSYVRGNWRRFDESGPMILTKCCHDMDAATWLVGEKVRSVASFGGISLFKSENAPAGAAKRCTDSCAAKDDCAFYAPKFYLGFGNEWPATVVSFAWTPEARMEALRTGPYGRCVFHSDNDVVDHQVVAAEFANGVTLDFAVRGNTFECNRTIRILGTEGEINGSLDKSELKVSRFGQGTGERVVHEAHYTRASEGSHSGGDHGVIRNFLHRFETGDHESIQRSLDIAVEGHLLAFAAEEARTSGKAVDMAAYRTMAKAIE